MIISDRDKNARDRLNKKYIDRKLTTAPNDVVEKQNQLKQIQADFEDDMIPISFTIIDYENIYFAEPSITIDQMLLSESLQICILKVCEEAGIDSKSLDSPIITPIINHSYTIEEWQDIHGSTSHILFRYKTDLRDRQIEQQQKQHFIRSGPLILMIFGKK